MKSIWFVFAVLFSTSACKLDRDDKAASSVINVARDNVFKMHPTAKCEEPGFQQRDLHSVRCVMPTGIWFYCTAGSAGFGCNSLPTEAQVEAAQAQQAQAKAQQAPQAPQMPPQAPQMPAPMPSQMAPNPPTQK